LNAAFEGPQPSALRTTGRRGYRPAPFVSGSVLGVPWTAQGPGKPTLYSIYRSTILATVGGRFERSPPSFYRYSEGEFGKCIMRSIYACFLSFCRDEQGGEVLEYSIVTGLIVLGAISVIGKVGSKVLARWNSLNSSM
jgi:pilus assembly protein Flp/PilA